MPSGGWAGVPKQYRDQAPRLVRLPDGSDAWAIEGQPLRQVPFDLYGGKGRDVWKPYGQNYATTPGTGPAEQRLKEQDIDGIDAEVLFPQALVRTSGAPSVTTRRTKPAYALTTIS